MTDGHGQRCIKNKKASTIKAGRSCFVPDGKGRKMGGRKEENKADCKENREENRGVNRKPGEKEVMICMNNINKGYMLGEEKVPVLRDVCFRVEKENLWQYWGHPVPAKPR